MAPDPAIEALVEAARALVKQGATVHGYDDHRCGVCEAYCPVADEHHQQDCALIELKTALEAYDA